LLTVWAKSIDIGARASDYDINNIQLGGRRMPFTSAMGRDIHFQKHGHKFGLTDAAAYEQMAEEFMFGVRDADTRECIRTHYPDRLRFKDSNRHFGVAQVATAFIKTFYPVSVTKVINRGGSAGFFSYECSRDDL
jgi:hypothetical protein